MTQETEQNLIEAIKQGDLERIKELVGDNPAVINAHTSEMA